MRKIISCLIFILFSVSSITFSQIPDYYIKKDTWIATLVASREAFIKQQQEINSRFKLDPGAWYSVGFFTAESGKSFDEEFPPEKDNSLNKQYDKGKYIWKKQNWTDGTIINFPSVVNSAVYIQRNIICDRDTSVKAYFGSDDGLKVWLNDNLIIDHKVDRGCSPNQDSADLKLKKGDNNLFIKVNNNQGGFAFYFSLYKHDPKEFVWSLIEKDFPNINNLMEISWVRNDNIWNKDWTPGNYSEIAKKYASAIAKISPEVSAEILKQSSGAKSISDIELINDEYVKVKRSEYVILTPKPSQIPKINGAQVYGVRPGSPFLYRIPATGKRPMEFSAENLPPDLHLDSKSGIITGVINKRGEYNVTFKAANKLGTANKKFKIICGDKIALTPPLGWNSWNCFASSVSDKKIRAAADAMVKSGLVNHGWTYINIDDYWETKPGSDDPTLQGKPRDKNGYINPNKRFPDMKALGNFIHDKGLKMGIYSSPGPLTCGGCVGSFQHENKDARKYGEWGVDYLKYDWCSYDGDRNNIKDLMKPYFVMRDALNKVKRDIVYSLCQYGMGNVWEWGAKVGGNCWRTTGDITDTWQSMSDIAFNQNGHEKYAGPGHWNDPDMLVVGMVGWGENLHPTRLTPDEQYTHISMWCLLSAPLLIGCDMTKLDDFTLGLLTNDEVLAVDQDPLGKQAGRISKDGNLEVWAKDLMDGSKAVGLFNRGDEKAEVTAGFDQLGLKGKCLVRDLWRQKDIGTFENHYKSVVPSHGVVLLKIKEE
jgi:alpha-galactosidase